MITYLGNVTIVVRNLTRARKFYRDVLGLRLAFFDRKHDWLCFDAGRNVTLSLTVPWSPASRKLVGAATGVSLYVDDIDATYAALRKKKVKFAFAPRTEPWGGRLANFADPDGNRFFLMELPADFRK